MIHSKAWWKRRQQYLLELIICFDKQGLVKRHNIKPCLRLLSYLAELVFPT